MASDKLCHLERGSVFPGPYMGSEGEAALSSRQQWYGRARTSQGERGLEPSISLVRETEAQKCI